MRAQPHEAPGGAVDFIAADIHKAAGAWRPLCGLGVLAAMAVVALGFGWRDDYDLSSQRPSGASLAALGMLVLLTGLAPLVWAWPRRTARARALGVCALLLAAVGVSLLPGPTARSVTEYASSARFIAEAAACLGKGLITAAAAGALGGWMMLRLLPLPSRPLQLVGSLLPGLAAATMLALHCSGTSPWHVLVAHWGGLLLVGPVALWLQRRVVARAIRRALGPGRGAHLERLEHLAD